MLCSRVMEGLPSTATQLTLAIRSEMREYAVVPLADHVEHVTAMQEARLRALMESRQPDADDLGQAASLGSLRASQGLSIETVLGAYHVSNRELWKELVVTSAGNERDVLPELATLMWETMGTISSTMADAHYSTSRSEHSQSLRRRHRLFELLGKGVETTELAEVAAALGFDLEQPFSALIVQSATDEQIENILRMSPATSGAAVSVTVDRGVLVLTQHRRTADLVGLIRRRHRASRIGVGLERLGSAGAIDTVKDADLCAQLTTARNPVVAFENEWLRASLLGDRVRLEPAARRVLAVASDNPHLLETVVSFARSNFSAVVCAAELHIHANTVAYRLDRWAALTGWNPRTFEGLTMSVALKSLSSDDY